MELLLKTWLFIFIFSNLRYFFLAGMVFLYFYVFYRQRAIDRKIQARFPTNGDIYREIFYSTLTAALMAAMITALSAPAVRGYTLLYFDRAAFGYAYFWLSVLLLIFIHDAYFYWMHRAVHHPQLFKKVHFVHHQSTNPTPWTSFSFHPLEGILEILIIPLLTFVLPLHPLAIGIFVLFMTIYNVYGHSGYELYPAWFARHPVLRWLNTSVNHNMHHRYFKGNYGLYFRFWDEWMGTTHPHYEQTFAQKARKSQKK
ncbi:MAG: sterol desaturase family protein [Microscillaceae bacterium]|nr:sterol desaturase family protein [Microscillaceae bacterium]